MSMTIWKFTLEPVCELQMPEGATVLSVGVQGENICLWAMVNPDAPKVTRSFVGFGTGHEVTDATCLEFIGTALLHGGSLVFHIFEKMQ